MPQLDLVHLASQLFWLAIFFFLLYAFNAYFFIPSLRLNLSKRSKIIKGNLEEIEQVIEESKKLKQEIDSIIIAAKSDAHAIKQDSIVKARNLKNAKIIEVNAKVGEYFKKAEEEFNHNKELLNNNLPVIIEEIKRDVISILTNTPKQK